MKLFILTFFALYGGMHAYAFFRARHALAFGTGTAAALALFMLLMTLAPFLIRALEGRGYELSARALSHVAYVWMALLFLFFCLSLLGEISNFVLRISGMLADRPLALPAKPWFLLASGLALILCVYGYFAALDIRTERLVLETSKLPAGIDHLKIVQISDVHLGLIVREERLKNILAIVKAEKPDIFVSTGDLVDAQINHMTELAELLRTVDAPMGKYAITGNHEYYAGLPEALAFTRSAGFTLLRGEAVKDGVINIAGVDDPAAAQVHLAATPSEKEILSALPGNKFTLLLKHRPSIDHTTVSLFDLQLSGHTHKGQIYPFTYISKMAYPLNAGRFDLPGGAVLRVSKGTGTWGPPVRVLSPPEITVIELVRKRQQEHRK